MLNVVYCLHLLPAFQRKLNLKNKKLFRGILMIDDDVFDNTIYIKFSLQQYLLNLFSYS